MVFLRRHAEAALESVTDNTGRGSGAGRRYEKVQIAGVQIIEELFLSDSGLYGYQTQFRIHLQNPIHSGKIQNDAAVTYGKRAAVTPVVACADCIERNLTTVCNSDNSGDVSFGARLQRCGDVARQTKAVLAIMS